MRVSRVLSIVLLLSAVAILASTAAGAGDSDKASRKPRKKELPAATPGRPSGAAPPVAAADAYYGGSSVDTITTFANGLGQTVYEIKASHFDTSPPLSELARAARTAQSGEETENELEAPSNPMVPPWRLIRSDVPDPVVQMGLPTAARLDAGGAPAAPVAGFNFFGVPANGLTPSDSNGSVGNDQFVEVVNTRYQIWSLNRVTNVATSILSPTNINVLWAGFGGACQAQNSGDPIVLFDKAAGRWLISQFTTGVSGGSYFQCVAISTTPDAIGPYNRWAFAVPNGIFGDYPHFGTWSDAYYMMAHGFANTVGGYIAALFAAMDRTKMLAGDPAATWQVILDPTESGHMPADLDGFAPPPTGAPGIFLSLHGTGMYLYRMKVDFNNPANTVRTRQATIPVAPSTGACGGGACIPQPGAGSVGSLGDRLMFRAAYRNLIDHESLVVSHSVDPSVAGVVSGVRWYDFRISGIPDAVCPSYPCLHQQGTIADAPGGRSRWMPSVAMDGAENMLVGYSTTGVLDGSDNHSIRYTGRAKADPLGTMTVPEVTIFTGTANSTTTRWGDYTSTSVDPYDDCTFWHVNQLFLTTGIWTTRIASAAWPSGSGPGQCKPVACLVRPSVAPAIGAATVPGDNQITVQWTGVVPAPGSYAIERAVGACGSEGAYQPVGSVPGTSNSFTDTAVVGGLSYAYRVILASDADGRCQSTVISGCASATATGPCNLKPDFDGATAGASSSLANCGVALSWAPTSSACPLTPIVRFNVYRGTTPDFVPTPASRIATCVPGPSSYIDRDHLASGSTYYYVVRAEDNSTGNGGPCNGGNEEANTTVVSGTAYGPGMQSAPGTWTDGGGDGNSFLALNVDGPGDTADRLWRFVKTADDPGANHTPSGQYAYRNAGPGPSAHYPPNACAEMRSPPLTIASSALTLKYWERHQLEYHWDGVAVEYAINGEEWNEVPAPSQSARGCSNTDDASGWEPLDCTQSPPINACGYPTTAHAVNGPLASGTSCTDWVTSPSVTPYAHRCHPMDALIPGDTIQFRWRFTSDPGAEFAGLYLDDIAVTGVEIPNSCVTDTCAGKPNGTACDDGVACTSGEVCGGGTCQTGPPGPPPVEVTNVRLTGHGATTLSWTAQSADTRYDIDASMLSDLRTDGVLGASCLANDVSGTSFVDPQFNPAAGTGFYYLVRGQTPCGTGTFGAATGGAERLPAAGCP